MASYNYMMSADEVAQELNCSKSYAYKLVKAMNKELAAQGYITMAGLPDFRYSYHTTYA